MPADPETSREMGEITGAIKGLGDSVQRLEQRIERSRIEAEESTRRIYQRIDSHAAEARAAATAMAESVVRLTTELHEHTRHDDAEFKRLTERVDEAERDQGRWWRTLAGMAGGGGLGAAIARWLDGGGGGT